MSRIPQAEAEPQASSTTLVYVVDIPATLAKQQLALDLTGGKKRSDGTLGKLYPLRVHRSDISSSRSNWRSTPESA